MGLKFPCKDSRGTLYESENDAYNKLTKSGELSCVRSTFKAYVSKDYIRSIEDLIDVINYLNSLVESGCPRLVISKKLYAKFVGDNPDLFQFPQTIDGVTYCAWNELGEHFSIDSTNMKNIKKRYGSEYNIYDIYYILKSKWEKDGIIVKKHNTSMSKDINIEFPCTIGGVVYRSLTSFVNQNFNTYPTFYKVWDGCKDYIEGLDDLNTITESFKDTGSVRDTIGLFLKSKNVESTDNFPIVKDGRIFSSYRSVSDYIGIDRCAIGYLLSNRGIRRDESKCVKLLVDLIDFYDSNMYSECNFSSWDECIKETKCSITELYSLYAYKYNRNKKDFIDFLNDKCADKRVIVTLDVLRLFSKKDIDAITVGESSITSIVDIDKERGSLGCSSAVYLLSMYVLKDKGIIRSAITNIQNKLGGELLEIFMESGSYSVDNFLWASKNLKYLPKYKMIVTEEKESYPEYKRLDRFVDDLNSYSVRVRDSYFWINDMFFVQNTKAGCDKFGVPIYNVPNDCSVGEREALFISKYIQSRIDNHNGKVTEFLTIECLAWGNYYRCLFYGETAYLEDREIIYARIMTAELGKSTNGLGVYATEEELCNFYNLSGNFYYMYFVKKSFHLGIKRRDCLTQYLIKGSRLHSIELLKSYSKRETMISITEPYLEKNGELKTRKRTFETKIQVLNYYSMACSKATEKEEFITFVEDVLLKRESGSFWLFGVKFRSVAHCSEALGIPYGFVKKQVTKNIPTEEIENLFLSELYTRRSIKLLKSENRIIGSLEIRRYSFTDSDGMTYFSCIDKEKGTMRNISGADLVREKIRLFKESLKEGK